MQDDNDRQIDQPATAAGDTGRDDDYAERRRALIKKLSVGAFAVPAALAAVTGSAAALSTAPGTSGGPPPPTDPPITTAPN